MSLIGIDVGGTNIKIGLIENRTLVKQTVIPTNSFDVIKQMINGCKELVESMDRQWDEVQAVGVGFPGLIIGTVVEYSPNLGLENCCLSSILEEELGVPVVVLNDADMAGLAEYKFGAGKNATNMIMLTVGTGVGGAIILNGKVYTGQGGSGEFGHIIIEKDGRKCACGMRGCAEQYLSMSALDKDAKETLSTYKQSKIRFNDGKVFASELQRCYAEHDKCATEIVDEYVKTFGNYILGLCNIFRPDTIVIGGGLSNAPKIIKLIDDYCKINNYGFPYAPKTKIVPAELGNKAGILGTNACYDVDEDGKVTISSCIADIIRDAPVTYTPEMLERLNDMLHGIE